MTAASDPSSQHHDEARSRTHRNKVVQNGCSCGSVAAYAVHLGHRAVCQGKNLSDVDFGRCILRPSDEVLDAIGKTLPYANAITGYRAFYPEKFISGVGIMEAVKQIENEYGVDDAIASVNVTERRIGTSIDLLLENLQELMARTGPETVHIVTNNESTAMDGNHWVYIGFTKKRKFR